MTTPRNKPQTLLGICTEINPRTYMAAQSRGAEYQKQADVQQRGNRKLKGEIFIPVYTVEQWEMNQIHMDQVERLPKLF